mgnify:CR=1 FL=1
MYAILSDQHAHKWSQFATTDADGVNSRLRFMLCEMERAADELLAARGKHMVFAGDLFHVRGSIDPEVFNPVWDTIVRILNRGVRIYAIPGNHDLSTRDTTVLGNAIQTLSRLENFHVITEPAATILSGMKVALVPWYSKIEDLKKALGQLMDDIETSDPVGLYDLVMHAGISGVLPNLDHGLSAEEVAGWGFKRVFAGHYHNHKIMEDGKVVSIGALTHQTFSDVGTKAGFLLVDNANVSYRASRAPSFVDIDPDTDEEEIPLRADGNFVRVRGFKLTDKEVNVMRQGLLDMGARGVTIQVAREVSTARSTSTAKGMSLEASVSDYVDKLGLADTTAIRQGCEEILSHIRSVAT